MADDKQGKFKLINKVSISDIIAGNANELPESDLCFQDEGHVIQYEYLKPDEEELRIIEPGIYTFEDAPGGLNLKDTELRARNLLPTVNNTVKIVREAKLFYSKLHIYDQLQRMKKRAVLIYSGPGMGKTSTICDFCLTFCKEDPGTVVIIWPTSAIDADKVSNFFATATKYDPKCTRLILIMEDIGGGERENQGESNKVDSGLLNLLDGVSVTFALPTFIVATTNHPENLLASLANRPGRFDLMIKLEAPSYDEKVQLTEFIAKRALTDDEKKALENPKMKEFSIAHLEEIVVRSLLHDKTMAQCIEELIEHAEKFKKNFDEKGNLGFGISMD